MTKVVAKARETSKFGSVPSVEAEWRVRGLDGDGRVMIESTAVRTCGPDGTRELAWFRDIKVARVELIDVEVEVDEYTVAQSFGWPSASPQSVVVAESEDTKFRELLRPPLTEDRRRKARFSVPRAQLGSHLLLSAHVVRGSACSDGDVGNVVGQYLARTPHTERLKIRFDAPDWKEGGGLPIDWTQFDSAHAELIWRWKGLENLADAEPVIKLELNSAHESIQSLLQSRDAARKWSRTAVAHFIAAEAMFELAAVAASQTRGGEIPQDTGIAAALAMVAERLQRSPADLIEDLSHPKTSLELMHELRLKFGMGYNMNVLAEIATRRGGAQ
jgi:hypothetical protein